MEFTKFDLTKDINLNLMTEEELTEYRNFLTDERNKILEQYTSEREMYDKLLKERIEFREEMKELNTKILLERKRLKEEQSFFDKKLSILQTGFANLEMDRKAFEKEKREYQYNNFDSSVSSDVDDVSFLFSGINSYLGLKKRYKDLLKIFHPDNMDGDSKTVVAIKEAYEKIKLKY